MARRARLLASGVLYITGPRSKEIPRAQLRAATPSLQRIFAKSGEKAIAEAYAHGYRLNEIASHLDVHYATVSRRLKRIEEAN